MNQKNFLVITLMLVAFAATSSALAQNSSSAKKDAAKSSTADDASKLNPNDFIELLRKDIRSQKKQIIAENMDLSDAEAEKFWPVYDQYAVELSRIYDTKIALLNDYAENYSSMTGAAEIEIHACVPQSALRQGNRIVLSTRLAVGFGNRRRIGASAANESIIDPVLRAFRNDEAFRMEWLDMREAFLCVLLLGVISIRGRAQESSVSWLDN